MLIRLQFVQTAVRYCDTLRTGNVAKKRLRERYRVFLSHSHKDHWIAKQCARILAERSGGRVEVFLDEKDIEVGESIADSIRTSIEQCDEFLVLLSRYSKDRPWVLIEMGAAWGLRKPIIAVIDKVGPKEMPDIISPYKATDLNDFDQYVDQLLKRMTKRR